MSECTRENTDPDSMEVVGAAIVQIGPHNTVTIQIDTDVTISEECDETEGTNESDLDIAKDRTSERPGTSQRERTLRKHDSRPSNVGQIKRVSGSYSDDSTDSDAFSAGQSCLSEDRIKESPSEQEHSGQENEDNHRATFDCKRDSKDANLDSRETFDGKTQSHVTSEIQKTPEEMFSSSSESDTNPSDHELKHVRSIHMRGQTNQVNINVNSRLVRRIDLGKDTCADIKYTIKEIKCNGSKQKKKTRIILDFEDQTAEEAAYFALNRGSFRDTIDKFMARVNFIVDLITPGSIIIEIQPTSDTSVRALIEAIQNGKMDEIIKGILCQENVFRHIKGKTISVNVDLEIPDTLLRKEGITIVPCTMSPDGDLQEAISVTLSQDKNDDDISTSSKPGKITDLPQAMGLSQVGNTGNIARFGDEFNRRILQSSSVDDTCISGASSSVDPIQYFSDTTLTRSRASKAAFKSTPKKRKSMDKLTTASFADMRELDPSEILLSLNKHKQSLNSILCYQSLTFDDVENLVDVLGKILLCESMTEWVNEVLATVITSPFLSESFANALGELDDDFRLNSLITNILPILRSTLLKMPSESRSKVQNAALLIRGKLRQQENEMDDTISKDLEKLFEVLEVVKSQDAAKTTRSKGTVKFSPVTKPEESYRKMPIIPRKEELDGSLDIFLLENQIGERFQDLEHYLECQFRLFRADAILPLKQNIHNFRKVKGYQSVDYRVYSDVRILTPVCTKNKQVLAYRIDFNPKPLGHVKWKSSQRLLYGSLLCLSADNFENNMLFATVENRDPDQLKKGLVDVTFLSEDVDVTSLSRDLRFDMVESPAYFESYKDVLKGFQTLTHETLPFQEYIVECQNTVNPPRYLQDKDQAKLDLCPLSDDFKVSTTSPVTERDRSQIVDVQRGPIPDIYNLDDSQSIAIRHALTREFALVHGPPGTGKTYVGIKILKVLLHNEFVWQKVDERVPILVVCYTNHALDQFLESLLDNFDGRLIRVGGRIKSERLKRLSLNEARDSNRKSKAVPGHLHEAEMNLRRQMDKLRHAINKEAAKIEAAEREIVHEDLLKDFMGKKVADNLKTVSSSSNLTSGSIGKWLGIEKNLNKLEIGGPQFFIDVDSDGSSEEDEETPFFDIGAERLSRRQLEDEPFYWETDSEEDGTSCSDGPHDNVLTYISVNVTGLDDYRKPTTMANSVFRETSKNKRRLRADISKQMSSDDRMSAEDARRIKDVWKMKTNTKWRLYRYWVNLMVQNSKSVIKIFEDEYKAYFQKLQEIQKQKDKYILKECSVIGMTTTGAARYQKILNEIGPKIILVEEAAEVLEAHIIGTLSKHCQHLILIGDHKQLRPNPVVHELAKRYQLEISLFERMIKSGIDCEVLEWQHRMRPEIADTIRSLYGGRLKDHDLVKGFRDIKGIASNVFFVEHQREHVFDEETKSFRNVFEADYVVALSRYLLKQGYSASQITILSFYSAQLTCIERTMLGMESIRIAAVDNYQGEENDIILLSLVRSKTDGNIGFLKENNRMCVALSRAKLGMYVIGNIRHISVNNELFKAVCEGASEKNIVGPALPLCCPRHPLENQMNARLPADFELKSEGGCNKPCDFRLQCGHVCPRLCHSNDLDHKEYKCQKSCQKKCRIGHSACNELCYKPCKCTETIAVTLPNCGHRQFFPCHMDPSQYRCQEPCETVLSCGHTSIGLCGVTPSCMEPIETLLPCGHLSKVACSQANTSQCGRPCEEILSCGHLCQGTCAECCQGRLHKPCSAKCKKIIICGHECKSTCNNCPPCDQDCENRCSHSKCKNKCGAMCTPCEEPCEKSCRHRKCTAPCGELCNMKRCNDRCRKKLKCMHPCLGLCGEVCPPVCRLCNKDHIESILEFFGAEDRPCTIFIQLEDCNHVFDVRSMDKWMDRNDEKTNTEIGLKLCPECRTPIRNSLRYGNIVNQGLQNIEMVKQRMTGNEEKIDNLKRTMTKLTRRLTGRDREDAEELIRIDAVPSEILLSTKISQLRFFYQAISMERQLKTNNSSGKATYIELLGHINEFKTWILRGRSCFSQQEVDDAEREIQRLRMFRYFLLAEERASENETLINKDDRETLGEFIKALRLAAMMKVDDMALAQQFKDVLKGCVPESTLGISDEERQMVVTSIGLNRGQWYKCKEGHIYAIGECGRADEEGTCPECGGAIGGISHQLSEDNTLAPEMDDAMEPPWSEEMDLEYALKLHQELNG